MKSDMGESSSRYLTAQVCLNGHATTDTVESSPERLQDFCSSCGARTVEQCSACEAPIRGEYFVPGALFPSTYRPPNYCHQCGRPYPWTEVRLEAAREMAGEMDLSDDDRELLVASLDHLVTDTPRTQVAATRTKRLLGKAGGAAAASFRDLLVDVASEAAKKVLWP